ncbi:hypothetical protein [Bacillus kwashiorkori]|uniref:hypothetical protein n=1 Tax=Bacillus kwashiorkori TaxID=1522318 RepID=UPI000782B308|nr:hypothetical protein [Bacillus kwashiorkori]
MAKRKVNNESKPLLFIQQPNFQSTTIKPQKNIQFTIQQSNKPAGGISAKSEQQKENFPSNIQNDMKEVPLINPETIEKIEKLWNRIKSQPLSDINTPSEENIIENKPVEEIEPLESMDESEKPTNVERAVDQLESEWKEIKESELESIHLVGEVDPINENKETGINSEQQEAEITFTADDKESPITHAEKENHLAEAEKGELIKEEVSINKEAIPTQSEEETSQHQQPTQNLKAIIRRLALYPRVLERPYCQANIHGEKIVFQVLSKRGDNVRLKTKKKIIVCKITDITEFEIIQ